MVRVAKDSDGNYVATFAGASPGITGLGRHASWQSCIDHCPYVLAYARVPIFARAMSAINAAAIVGRLVAPLRGLLPVREQDVHRILHWAL